MRPTCHISSMPPRPAWQEPTGCTPEPPVIGASLQPPLRSNRKPASAPPQMLNKIHTVVMSRLNLASLSNSRLHASPTHSSRGDTSRDDLSSAPPNSPIPASELSSIVRTLAPASHVSMPPDQPASPRAAPSSILKLSRRCTFADVTLENLFQLECGEANHQQLQFAWVPAIIALAVAHRGGFENEDQQSLAYLSFIIESAAILAVMVYIACRHLRILSTQITTWFCLAMAWYFSLNVSHSATSRRLQILGLPEMADSELCDEGVQTMWVALILAYAAMCLRMNAWRFFIVSQLICLQHLLITVTIQRPECGQDGRLSISLVSGLQLHILAIFLAGMHRQIDVMLRIGFSARYATTPFQAKSNYPDDMVVAFERSASGIDVAVQNPQERAVRDLGSVEVSCRKFLDTMQQLPEAQEDWMPLIEGTVNSISSCRQSLRENRRTTKHGLRDATMKGCVTPISSSSESSIVQSYLEMMFTEDTGPRQHRIQSISLMSASSPETVQTPVQSRTPQSLSSLSEEQGPRAAAEPVRANVLGSRRTVRSKTSLERRMELNLGDWHCDMLMIAVENPHVLQTVGFEFLNEFGIFQTSRLLGFLKALEGSYHSANPYHSHIHGADTCNSFFFLLRASGLWHNESILDFQKAMMIIAALGHDVGHAARSNQFLVATGHEWALIYNDRSVSENFHAATTWRLVNESCHERDLNLQVDEDMGSLVQLWSAEQLKASRNLLIHLVLATDMQHHFDDLSSFRLRLGSEDFNPFENPKDELQSLQMLFHAADLSHSAKGWNVHLAWSERICEEFHQQGDEERTRGMPISPLCERDGFKMPASQVGFLQYVCVPMWRELKHLEELKKVHAGGRRWSMPQALDHFGTEPAEGRGPGWSARMLTGVDDPIQTVCFAQCDRNLQEWKHREDDEKPGKRPPA
eukprot:gnl/MRDRNA2_/MRDRNA2_166606_c0_seq1.p1 gnl/MRDRNA2_/MRDRNA2_166606_c0~~gnl/MRDRNA2_/MRDRNA2_166606_c0_seq1.p1  ORF type:complete len:922 (+),score=142.77 gnl/MRDRNA2_/MRDRNA2_166606_c0_seq1:46-2811(+)